MLARILPSFYVPVIRTSRVRFVIGEYDNLETILEQVNIWVNLEGGVLVQHCHTTTKALTGVGGFTFELEEIEVDTVETSIEELRIRAMLAQIDRDLREAGIEIEDEEDIVL